MRKSILWLILHLHTKENTILGGVKFYEWPFKVKFQGQSRIEWFFDNIRRIVHILYTLKEGKTIIVINYVCPANYMKIDWELIELWPLLICLKTVIWGFSRAKKQTVHICIHFKEEKKLSSTFYKSSENGVQNILCIQCIYFSYESKFLGHSQPENPFIRCDSICTSCPFSVLMEEIN